MLLLKQNIVHFHSFLESYTILSFFGSHLGFGSHFESFYSHNGNLLSELRKYVFLCILAVKCYF